MDLFPLNSFEKVDEFRLLENKRISLKPIPDIYNQIKNFEIEYDSDGEVYICKNLNRFLKQRYNSRLSRFKLMKRKYNLNFTTESEKMIDKFVDFVNYKKPINYLFFYKTYCEYFNIPHELSVKFQKKYEIIWTESLDHNNMLKSRQL